MKEDLIIELHTIATFKGKVYELQDLLNEILKENTRLNNIINGIDEILINHINECREELNTIMKGNDLDYINECSREFDVIRKNIEMIMEKLQELKGDSSNE